MKKPDPVTVSIWYSSLILLAFVPLLAIPLGIFKNVNNGFGMSANLAMIPALLISATLLGYSKIEISLTHKFLRYFFILFITYAVSGLFWGINNPLLSGGLIWTIVAGYAAYLGAYFAPTIKKDPLPSFFKYLILGSAPIICLPFIVSLFRDAYEAKEWVQEVYGFGNPRALGQYATVIIAIMIGVSPDILKKNHSPYRKIIFLGFLSMMWSILMWSGSRAGVASLLIGIPIAFALIGSIQWKSLLAGVISMVIGAGISLLYYIPNSAYSILARLSGLENSFATKGITTNAINEISSSRLDVWAWSIKAISIKPLTGWGFLPLYKMRSLKETITPDDPNFDLINTIPNVAHAHNIILDYSTGFGIPLSILIFTIVAFLWVKAAVNVRKNPTVINTTSLMILTILPIYSMMSIVLLLPFQMIIFSTCLGSMIAAKPTPSADQDSTDGFLTNSASHVPNHF